MKILALDLGSNSIGATIRDLSDKQNQIKKTSVITFETGVGKDDKGKYTLSHAAERTNKRSLRRLYQSRKYKLWKTLEVLRKEGYSPIKEESLKKWKYYNKEEAMKGNGGRTYPVHDKAFTNWIKLDFNGDNKPDYTTPYQLREELAKSKLDFTLEENRHKLGRALYHIAQHRGFKSSKKVQNTDDEKDEINGEDHAKDKGAEKKRRNKFWDAIENFGFKREETKTVGQVFSEIEKENKKNGTNIRIRKELHQFVTRKMLMQEVETIFKFQELKFGTVFKNSKGESLKISQSAMFWQRPLRSQKGIVGKCTLETNKYRCPVSHPAFEEFRAWSFLNSIQYKLKNDKDSKWSQIPLDLREKLYGEKFFRRKTQEFNHSEKDFYFFEIIEWLKKKNQHDNWQFNYDYKVNVAACPVSSKLKDIFGEGWQNYSLTIDKTKEIKRKGKETTRNTTNYNIESIWHLLFESDDEDFIEEFASELLRLDDKKINKFLGLYKSMPVAYGMLSLKAINNILPFLRLGLIYTDATLLAKVPKILGNKIWVSNEQMILANLQKHVIEKNRDEKRILNIVNNLIAQYKAMPQNEKFAEKGDYELGARDAKLDLNSEYTDINQILRAIKDSYGENTWREKVADEQKRIVKTVSEEYQSFFFDKERMFKKLPHLQKSMKEFLADTFDFLYCPNTFQELQNNDTKCNCTACKKLDSLYHPSQINIYPPAKEFFYKYGDVQKKIVILGSPKTGAFKNPMAMRALHELRKFVNYLIATEQIDEQTRIVVEIPRDSNLEDNNKRWAWNEYQTRRREENKEFRDAIYELLKDPEASGSIANPDSDSDIDKFRIWYEMIEGNDAVEGYENDKKFIPLKKTRLTKKNRKGKEEEIEEFNENNYLKINKSLFFKLQKAKDKIETRYRLWKEQGYRCLYTGRIIGITELFQENVIDFEHTIPRSKSLDNSLANLTVCDANFNRNIKKNRIPFELDNYEDIKQNLKQWEQKVKDLKMHVEFWKNESKKAITKDRKDQCVRQKHLWQFDLSYWENKVNRFTMEEIKGGFRKSQLIDTKIISKYAFHYLKTFFNTVEVQKGEVTAIFRKIFGIQELHLEKDRSKHSHHAKDAVVLSLIPSASIRDKILQTWYKIDEQKRLLTSETEHDKQNIENDVKFLEQELEQLIYQCNIPDVNKIINEIDEKILINNTAKDNSLTVAKKRIRSRGKIVSLKDKHKNIIYQTDKEGNNIQRRHKDGNLVWKNDDKGQLILDENGNKIPVLKPKEKWAKGDTIRGQLHKDSFLGAIKLVKKDDKGKWVKNEAGEFEFEEIKYVIREELVYKKNVQSPGFKDLSDLSEQIIDKKLFEIIKKQVEAIGDFKLALTQGIWMLDKNGNKVNRIRRVRIELRTKNAISLKKQSHKSIIVSKILPDKNHKETFWVENKERPYFAMYKDADGLTPETLSLNDIANRKATALQKIKSLKDLFETKKDDGSELYFTLVRGQKIIFLKEPIENIEDTPDYYLKSLYKIEGFEEDGRMTLQHHLISLEPKNIAKVMTDRNLPEAGATKIDFENPIPRIRPRLYMIKGGKQVYNFAIEGKHFKINPDGEIKWLR